MTDAWIVIGFILSMVAGYVVQPAVASRWSGALTRRRQGRLLRESERVLLEYALRAQWTRTQRGRAYAVTEPVNPTPTSPRSCAQCGSVMVFEFIPPFFTRDQCPVCSTGMIAGVEAWGN